tara:strand:+ start:1229 stop:1459 length:231 start_codon:yes stop_codon:yes gene_type:complete
MLYYNNNQQIEELKKMTEEQIKELISTLKEINSNLSNLNLILISSDIGRNLKTYTNYEINKNLLPKYKKILKEIND